MLFLLSSEEAVVVVVGYHVLEETVPPSLWLASSFPLRARGAEKGFPNPNYLFGTFKRKKKKECECDMWSSFFLNYSSLHRSLVGCLLILIYQSPVAQVGLCLRSMSEAIDDRHNSVVRRLFSFGMGVL